MTQIIFPTHSAHLTSLRQHLDAYLDCLNARNYSTWTLTGYQERLLPFVNWCEARGVMSAPQVSPPLLESYQSWLKTYRKADGHTLAVSTQSKRLSDLRVWFRWLRQRQYVLYNPAEGLVLPRRDKRLPAQVLSEDETQTVLQAIDINRPTGLRNRAILEVLWSSGIRRMELSNLRLSDIDFGRGVLLVRQGKGRKDRVVPIGEQALRWLQRYLDSVRPRLARRYDCGHLFITLNGRQMSRDRLTHLTGASIRQKAQLDKAGACHLFRHSMATQMLENGADTRHIQAILGHASLETTQIYTRVAIGHLKKVHEQTHPAERKSKQSTPPDDKQADSDRPDSPKPV
ncbi:site-specific tyrosine recombinase XerC [Photorhabdus luminescens]|uniref:Recombinase XerD n=1 Tax=Photorhabdus luminescens subsp. mexicana TaxID=2100167 RepID=A0A4R4IX10_PHOLU|nr:site-specific tyrosine recombinase XerC [Photorhabdus luminescens]TDB45463.1 recombinase XerD [Photorhabdus luminescens subsp. mexicana]